MDSPEVLSIKICSKLEMKRNLFSGSILSTATKVPWSVLVTWKGSLALSLVVTLWEYAPTSLSFQHCYLMSSSIGCHCDDDGDGHDSDDSHGDEHYSDEHDSDELLTVMTMTVMTVMVMSC